MTSPTKSILDTLISGEIRSGLCSYIVICDYARDTLMKL